jgi:hypothetical protein
MPSSGDVVVDASVGLQGSSCESWLVMKKREARDEKRCLGREGM